MNNKLNKPNKLYKLNTNNMHKLLLFLFSIILLSTGCKDDEDTSPASRDEFFIANFDGTEKNLTYSTNAYNIGFEAENSENFDSTGTLISYTIGPGASLSQDADLAQFLGGLDTETDERVTMFFGQNVFTEREWALDSLNNFDSIFGVGTQPYMDNDPANAETPGIEIRWTDDDLKTWSTRNGTQSGSTFNVTKSEPFTIEGMHQNKVDGTFNCKLYDTSGNSINVTGGTFFMTFQIL